MRPSETPVQARGLRCGYGDREVLAEVDLELLPGSLTALLGPNGSGKSTLLKSLCKELHPLAGEVTLFGKALAKLPHDEVARLVAYVPQEEMPPFRFTVRQIVLMGRLPHSSGLFDTPEDQQAATEAMRDADCLHLESRPINEISGGERQRVLIARALAQRAPILLLDEPTAHLDVGHQVAVIRLLRELADRGRCVIAAVHDLNWAAAYAKDALLLYEGRIALRGGVSEVLRDPLVDRAYDVSFRRFDAEGGELRMFPVV